MKRGPLSRRRSEQLVSPGSVDLRSDIRSSGKLVLVDPDDPVVHVSVPERIMVDDDVSLKPRRSLASGLMLLKALEEDDDPEVTVSRERLTKMQKWRQSTEVLKDSSSSGHASLTASRESFGEMHRSNSASSERMPPPPPQLTASGGMGTVTTSVGPKRAAGASRPKIEVIDSDGEAAQPSGVGEDLALRRAEEFIALQRSAVRTSNNTLAEANLLSRQVSSSH